jgi:hypothetical protein
MAITPAEEPSGALLTDDERLARRAQILALQEHMLGMDPSQHRSIDEMTKHHFASGVYCREMRVAEGDLVVGRIHRTENLAILLQGRMRVTSEEGTVELEAPQIMVSAPGIKRVGLALTDVIWLSIHAVGEERDLDVIAERFTADSYDEIEAQSQPEQIAEAI